MILVTTLTLALGSADPALAGAAPPPAPENTVVIDAETARSVHTERRVYTHGATRVWVEPGARVQAHRETALPGHARGNGQTVQLGADLIKGGLTGGVEASTYRSYHYGRGVVVITGAHAPRSAGQAAAARGLPRG